MMTPPKAAAAWDMEVLGEEQRDGYKAQKIAFNINAYSRITAYLLIPDGREGALPNGEWRFTIMVPISLSERRR